MSKTLQEYLGNNVRVEEGFIKLSIADLMTRAELNTPQPPAPDDAPALTALIIRAIFKSTVPNTDDFGLIPNKLPDFFLNMMRKITK